MGLFNNVSHKAKETKNSDNKKATAQQKLEELKAQYEAEKNNNYAGKQ